MGKHHKLSDNEDGSFNCAVCGPTDTWVRQGVVKCKGIAEYALRRNHNLAYKRRDRSYIKFKGDSCEMCGFIPIHPGQLDVDHIDGNHHNNTEENLWTLCANCHRLKDRMPLDKARDLVDGKVVTHVFVGDTPIFLRKKLYSVNWNDL